jgi:transposase-like protein
MEMVVNGVSTRKVTQITEELCGTEFSKSTVSELYKRLDPVVTAWNNRPLHDTSFPFVIVDALVLKVREDGRVRSRGALVGIGVNTDGNREVLGLMLGDSESEISWSEFFSWLKSRGLGGVDSLYPMTMAGWFGPFASNSKVSRGNGVRRTSCEIFWMLRRKHGKTKCIARFGPF